VSTYTGTGSNATLGHGLGAVPGMVLIKHLTITNYSHILHITGMGTGWSIIPNDPDAQTASSTHFNSTNPTSSVVAIGTYVGANTDSSNFVMYCWADVEGYSKHGTYEGNGNVNGTFVWCGFRPALIMCKSIDSTSTWNIFDHKRAGYNVDNNSLFGDTTAVEGTADLVDILSNGFKLRIATDPNVAETYIFSAFAEFPFGGDGVSQARAR
jgi:hypothetical protein